MRRWVIAAVLATSALAPFDALAFDLERVLALQRAQQHGLALEELDRAEPTAEAARRGVVDGLSGTSLLALGREEAAAAAFRRSVVRAELAGDGAVALRSTINLASALAAGEARAAALATLDEAHDGARDAGRRDMALLAATNALTMAATDDDRTRWLGRALDAEAALPPGAAARTRLHLAAALVAGGDTGREDWRRAEAILDRALEAEMPAAMTAQARLIRGRLRLLAGDADAALARFDEAALLAARAGAAPAVLARAQWQAARLRKAAGAADALARYRQAMATITSLRRAGAPLRDARGEPWPLDVEAAFRDYLALLLDEADRATPARRASRLEEVRTTIERLRSFELERFFADDCVARLQATVTAVEAVSPTTAVYYALLTPGAAHAVVSLDGELFHRRLEVSRAELDATARSFRRNIENRTSHAFFADGRKLHAWLLEPWRETFAAAGVETIVFVGDGSLRHIPLAALHDGERFVVERYATALVPGLSLFDPRPVPDGRLRFLSAALSEPVSGFPALPHTTREVEAIRDAFGGVVLQNETFNAAALGREIRGTPVSVVHIASHGRFRGNGDDSFILTHDGRLGLDELDALLTPTRLRERPIELLTLSACETAVGDDQAALGLAGLAVKAGARSAVASLWSINDESSAELVTAFYQVLAGGGVSRAEALRRAQLEQLEGNRFRHPAYWAPFVVIGNWL